MSPTIVSAPGKVLVAGGYLVLDRQYTGLVVATSSRFYCIVSSPHSRPSSPPSTDSAGPAEHGNPQDGPNPRVDGAMITVRAGQFPEDSSIWTYSLTPSSSGITVSAHSDTKNKFVEITVKNAMQVIVEHHTALLGNVTAAVEDVIGRIQKQGGLEVVVLANNDFYSQRESLSSLSLPPLISSLDAIPPFNPLPRPIGQTNKTGLGSSAALVTSLTAGLLAHFNVVSIAPSPTHTSPSPFPLSVAPSSGEAGSSADLGLIHNLSQFSHCLAQGKVGSGFDISSAVYGTHIYRRFSPSILAPLMSAPPLTDSTSTQETHAITPHLAPSTWDHDALPFSLPKGLRLLLADVDAGTDTPSFVGKVLKWREENQDVAKDLWDDLGRANDALGDLLQALAKLEGTEEYRETMQESAKAPIQSDSTAQPISLLLQRIQAALRIIRSHLQNMSQLSGVPIEPVEQTRLLDACCALPGVLGGTVPGAGGYDAIVLLVIDTPEVVARVEEVWSGWTEMSVCPLSARQSDGGVQSETLDSVPGLKQRLGW